MRNSAASSHRPAYHPIPGVKGSLRRAAPALDPRRPAVGKLHHPVRFNNAMVEPVHSRREAGEASVSGGLGSWLP
ncbi:MAG: hypothetical protein ACREB3_09990, partial [Burkholderiales bacterium]